MTLIEGGGKAFGGTAIVLVIIAFIEAAIAIGLVALRFVKTRKQHVFRWDLFWVVLATLTGIALQLLGLLAALNGLGRSKTELSEAQIANALKWSYIGLNVGTYALAFGKLAIIALYLSIAQAVARRERYFLWVMAFIVSAAAVVQITLNVTQCVPLRKLWDFSSPGVCAGSQLSIRFGYFQGAFSAFTDLVLALYPIPIIMHMKGSKATKISICLVMAGGLIPFAAAVGRSIHLRALERHDDLTRDLVPLCIWAVTEQWTVIILGCLPPLRSFFARYFRHLASTPTTSRTQSPVALRSPTHDRPTATMTGDMTDDFTTEMKHDTPKPAEVMITIAESIKERDTDIEKAPSVG
ncbi:Hypothetical protein D9617_9g026110 [Elsinoe fawcettii]|nr:Hypothetical protein D9617_9g026110 [Elsinoe fawcettii]